jgi:wobble nucleotide-excising tRNase
MRPTIPGVTISDLPSVPTILNGTESIEIDMPLTLANGQVTTKTFKTTLNDLLAIYGRMRDNPNRVTSAQVGSYSIAQIEDLLRTKLSVSEAAINSMKLDGVTRQQIVEEARNGTVANSMRLGGELPEFYSTDNDFTALVNQLTDSFIQTASDL